MQADAMHARGQITGLEIATAILIVALTVVSVVCFRLIKDMSSSYKKDFSPPPV
jgi:hypothetical protein